MERPGGSQLAQKLEELRDALSNYYGLLNEIRLGLIPEERPVKPEALKYVEQMDAFGLPLVSGGILDQPYIFMQEYKVVKDVQSLYLALLEAQKDNGLQDQPPIDR